MEAKRLKLVRRNARRIHILRWQPGVRERKVDTLIPSYLRANSSMCTVIGPQEYGLSTPLKEIYCSAFWATFRNTFRISRFKPSTFDPCPSPPLPRGTTFKAEHSASIPTIMFKSFVNLLIWESLAPSSVFVDGGPGRRRQL
jgi:hypothetical protein